MHNDFSPLSHKGLSPLWLFLSSALNNAYNEALFNDGTPNKDVLDPSLTISLLIR